MHISWPVYATQEYFKGFYSESQRKLYSIVLGKNILLLLFF